MSALFIRLATEADLPAINAIYNHYVVHSTCTYQLTPDTAEARLEWFRSHDAQHPVTVAEGDDGLVGWASLNVYNRREGYARTVETSLYIHPGHHRRGYGRALLGDLVERARAFGHHTILAGVSAEQTPSMALHAAAGFVEVARYREVGWKHGQWLDVVYFQLLL
jgi:phosphinothricin acetyltransferase